MGFTSNRTVMYPVLPSLDSEVDVAEEDEGSGFCADRTCGSFWRFATVWSTWLCTSVRGFCASCRTTCAPVPPAAGSCFFRSSAPVLDWVPGRLKSSEYVPPNALCRACSPPRATSHSTITTTKWRAHHSPSRSSHPRPERAGGAYVLLPSGGAMRSPGEGDGLLQPGAAPVCPLRERRGRHRGRGVRHVRRPAGSAARPVGAAVRCGPWSRTGNRTVPVSPSAARRRRV